MSLGISQLHIRLDHCDLMDGTIGGRLDSGSILTYPIRVCTSAYALCGVTDVHKEKLEHNGLNNYLIQATVLDIYQDPEFESGTPVITLKVNQYRFIWIAYKIPLIPQKNARIKMKAELFLEGWFFYLNFKGSTQPFNISYIFQLYRLTGIRHYKCEVIEKPLMRLGTENYFIAGDLQSTDDLDYSFQGFDDYILTLELEHPNARELLLDVLKKGSKSIDFDWHAPFLG